MPLTTKVLIALLAGLATGILASISGNESVIRAAILIEPLGQLFINAIRMTVIPLVVGCLIAGIADAPDPASLGRGGMRVVLLYVVTLTAGGVFAAVIAPPILARMPLDPAASADLLSAATGSVDPVQSQAGLPGFTEWFVGLVPTNPFRAASDGAILPLIVFSLAFGLAIAAVKGAGRDTLVRFFEGVRDASLKLVTWILEASPIGVFALALPLAARLGVAAAGALALYAALVAVLTVVFTLAVIYPMAPLLGRIPLREFARAALPAQALAFSSRSSLASLPAVIQAARDLRLPDTAPGFFIPMAAALYRIGATVGQTVGIVFIARLYGVQLSPVMLATTVLIIVATSFSVPGIPGGSIVIMAPVLQAAGLPLEGIGILLGADTIPDMFRTTANVTGQLASAVAVTGRERRESV